MSYSEYQENQTHIDATPIISMTPKEGEVKDIDDDRNSPAMQDWAEHPHCA